MSVALVCIAKDEDYYIDEWLKYNIKLQFSSIYVYQNNWRYLGNKSQYTNVNWCIIDGEKKQFAAYNDFLNKHFNDYNWACFFDCDEYLVMQGYDNVHKYFSQFNQKYGIAINWKIFGDSNLHFNNDYSILSRFKMCQTKLDKHVKACLNLSKLKELISTNQIYFDNPHYIHYAGTHSIMNSSDGKRYIIGPFNKNYDDTTYICHFFGKTIEEYKNKQRRGRAASPNNTLNFNIFHEFNINECINTYAFNFMNSIISNCNNSINIDYEQIMKNSFAISIDKSKYDLLTKIFNASNFKFIPKMFNGCVNKKIKPFQRCTQSHVDLITQAKQKDLPFVLVFEDDAYPCIECVTKFKNYIKNIPSDAKMIILGWSNSQKNSQRFDQKFNKVTTHTLCGSHAYILFNNGYDDYLNYFKNHKEGKADNHIYQVMKAYVIDKPLFIQYSKTKSMINGHSGYIFYGDHKNPPNGFISISKMLAMK